MSVAIVFHSETGNTEGVAKRLASACGGELIPVRDCAGYNRITMYLRGAARARRRELARIEPAVIDISRHSLVVVGSPVWAWSPTPAANAAIAALRGCEGKKGIVFATCGGKPGETLVMMKDALAARGVDVVGAFPFARKDLRDELKLAELVSAVKQAAGQG
ncbi:MAG: ArsR family transcriptional regulator [Methanomicrobiales archaeon]|nr:ArsR family transcriptional regulator [Methanomicrobiales archaeon]MDD1659658.1 ArsR family transcriptional regulator [Methanomicrobiales archaeon]